jgi:hypothetical protein
MVRPGDAPRSEYVTDAPENTLMCSIPTRDSPPGGLGVVGRDGIGVVDRETEPSFGFPPSVHARHMSAIPCSNGEIPTIFETVEQVRHITVVLRPLRVRCPENESWMGAGKGGGASLTICSAALQSKQG